MATSPHPHTPEILSLKPRLLSVTNNSDNSSAVQNYGALQEIWILHRLIFTVLGEQIIHVLQSRRFAISENLIS